MSTTALLRPLAAAFAFAALAAGSASAAATPSASPEPSLRPAATTQGIIMRDGGICDPIRHMGC